MTKEAALNDRSDTIFLIAALTLIAGVPTALYAIYYFADSVELVATLVLMSILLVSLLGLLIVRYRDRLISYIFKVPTNTTKAIAENVSGSIENYVSGNNTEAREHLTSLITNLVARYTWIQTRRWIMTAATGLLLGFAGLVGSALLKQQNDLILDQNRFFQRQIDQQGRQLELQQSVANQTVRSEAIRRIYGPEFADTPRVKAEAVRSLVAVERVNIEAGVNTLPTDFINLHDAELAKAWLDSADLRKISFRGADLTQANFNEADLTESVFRFSQLKGATFLSTTLIDGHLMFSDAAGAVLSNANLTRANINQTDLKGALLSSVDVTEASFFKVNLEGANIEGLTGWQTLTNIEGTNIAGVQNAPDGFVEWALANGAVSEIGALSDLAEAAEEMRRLEETAE